MQYNASALTLHYQSLAVKIALRLRLNSEQPGCHIRTETVPAKSRDCFHVSHSDFFECGWAGSVLVQWS